VAADGSGAAGVLKPALLDDYRALRHGLGARRLARDVLSVRGPDAADYLQGQCSQDLASLALGGSTDSLLLEPDGKLCALVRVTRVGDDHFAVDVDGGFGEAVARRLARFRLRSKVTLEPLAWPCVALRGPRVADLPGRGDAGVSDPAGGGPLSIPVSWHGVEGIDLLGPGAEEATPEDARWCGEWAWEALRVEAGIPAMGRELDGRTIAAEAGLVERTVSFTKGCYTGQELVARLDARGNRVARRLCGVVLGGGAGTPRAGVPPGDVAGLVGAAVVVEARPEPVGVVTSAAWCPGLDAPAGLAYLHRSATVPGEVTVVPLEGSPVPGEPLAAAARALPLVGA
jgi:folate-binding protein YgfZ